MKNKKSLFVHDYFQNLGGGEKLILSLVRNEDYLITSFVDNKILKFLKKKRIKILQDNNKISLKIKKIITPFYFNFSSNNLCYKNCVISGNYSVFFNLSNVKNKIFYCHSLPKIFFDYGNFYSTNIFFKYIIKLIGVFFKKMYIKKISRFNHIIANSNYTKKKINKHIKKKVLVIYPPIENFKYNKKGKYFLSNSRHEIDKNIDSYLFKVGGLGNTKHKEDFNYLLDHPDFEDHLVRCFVTNNIGDVQSAILRKRIVQIIDIIEMEMKK